MISIEGSNTVALLGLALDATSMRQQALAQNIANVNTPGYQRIGVSFESRIAELKQAVEQGRALPRADLAAFQPVFEVAEAGIGGDTKVSLDTEVAQMSENTLHHQALLKMLNKHYALIGLALNDGKR